jgi:hypothetical protein
MIDFDALAERALIEFPDLVSSCRTLENKLRIYLRDGSYIDFWWGMKLQGKFAYHFIGRGARSMGRSFGTIIFPMLGGRG